MAGRVLHEQGHLKQAQEVLERSITLRAGLVERDPEEPRWQDDLASGYNNLANVLWEQDDPAGGRKANDAAMRLRSRLAELDPADRLRRRKAAVSREKVGDFRYEEGHFQEALQAYQEAARTYRDLVRLDPAFTDAARDIARVVQSIGDTFQALKDPKATLAAYREAQETAEKFARQDPANVQWQRLVLGCRLKIGQAKGAADAAVLRDKLEILRALRPLAEQAGRRDPARVRWQSDVAEVDLQIGLVHAALAGKGQDVAEHQARAFEACTAAAQALEEAERRVPTYLPATLLHVEAYQAMGKLREQRKEAVAAQEAYLKSWQVLLAGSERFAAAFPDNPKWPRQQAECRQHIADHLARLAELGKPAWARESRGKQ
jgi:tetratricopeptide (TPR) repeat protein